MTKIRVIRNIKSNKIKIKNNIWIIKDAEIFIENVKSVKKDLKIKSNFNYERIQSLYSNLSSLSIFELYELKKNYKLLGYSTVEVDVQMQKLISYPFYFLLMTIFASIIMFIQKLKHKYDIGLFFPGFHCYINNFFMF